MLCSFTSTLYDEFSINIDTVLCPFATTLYVRFSVKVNTMLCLPTSTLYSRLLVKVDTVLTTMLYIRFSVKADTVLCPQRCMFDFLAFLTNYICRCMLRTAAPKLAVPLSALFLIRRRRLFARAFIIAFVITTLVLELSESLSCYVVRRRCVQWLTSFMHARLVAMTHTCILVLIVV